MKLRLAIAVPVAAGLGVLAGCSSQPAVPVLDRGPAVSVVDKAAVAAVAPVDIPPGHYLVKKGDTLIRISLDNGQDYREVASWNKLEDPNKINVGQLLRVVPPDGAVVVKPIAPPPSPIAMDKADRPTADAAQRLASDDLVKREPKGGTQPYSEEVLVRMRQPEVAAAPKSAEKLVEKPVDSKPSQEKVAVPAAADSLDWAWPSNGKVLAGFNEASNKGVDIAGKPGDPVQAAAAGKVVYAGAGLRGYGNLVIIKHDSTYLSAYAHNSKILVKEGQGVAKGMKIAEVGSSDADQPKLHFEIRKQGKPVDPLTFLPRR